MASCYGESWFVAATWQITIVAGVLLTPLFGGKIPVKNLLFSAVILLGIFLLQLPHLESMESGGYLKALVLILVVGISYPLGNRKMMAHCPAGISTTQRVFGMTLCSMPFWLLCSAYALLTHGLPSSGQILQPLSVALFSGVIATLLFFEATSLVRHNPKQLAVVEATQAHPAGGHPVPPRRPAHARRDAGNRRCGDRNDPEQPFRLTASRIMR